MVVWTFWIDLIKLIKVMIGIMGKLYFNFLVDEWSLMGYCFRFMGFLAIFVFLEVSTGILVSQNLKTI